MDVGRHGKVLTITRPTGGTIVGPGIECGTAGNAVLDDDRDGRSDRARRRARQGSRLQRLHRRLRASRAHCDDGSRGRAARASQIRSREPRRRRRSGSRLPSLKAARSSAAGGILCGVNGSTCTADLPSGAPVTLKADAAEGFAWEQFTGDCPSTGEMADDVGDDVRRDVHPAAPAPNQRRPPPSATLARPRPTTHAAATARRSSASGRGNAAPGVRPDRIPLDRLAARRRPPRPRRPFRTSRASAAHHGGGAREEGDWSAGEELLRRAEHAQPGERVRKLFHLDNERAAAATSSRSTSR